MDLVDEQIDATDAGVPRPDGRLRPLPRPQVRPDPAEGLLRPGRHLPQHRDLLRHHPASSRASSPAPLLDAAEGRGAPAAVEPLDRPSGPAIEKQIEDLQKQIEGPDPADDLLDRQAAFVADRSRSIARAEARHRTKPTARPKLLAMGVRERGGRRSDSPLFVRGELDKPGETVPRGVAAGGDAEAAARSPSGSGRLRAGRLDRVARTTR